MKIDDLLEDNGFGAYILGNIFAFEYEYNNNFVSLFSSREQKATNHSIDIKKFYDLINRIEKYYNISIKKHYSEIKKNNNLKKILRNQIGLFALIKKNRIDNKKFILKDFIFSKIKIKDEKIKKNFSINFIRGVVDARSSPDTTTIYVAMDIKRQSAITFATIMDKAFSNIFGFNTQKYNINPRFNQPQKNSRMKNPQFRIPYTILFGTIGSFRIQYLEKLKKHKKELWKKFQINTDVPDHFDDLIKWNTTNIPYTARVNNIKKLKNDVEYLNQYKAGSNNNILYQKLSDKNVNLEHPNNKRQIISDSVKKKVLKKCNNGDYLEIKKKIERNKYGKLLLCFHHIIPYKFNFLFFKKETINSFDNLITLRADTHYFLHYGEFNETKKQYLKQLYNLVKKTKLLNKENINFEISFDYFKEMY